ncbi:hypothetical protein Q1695_007545 [Nippostrongylus brasiliensis]|nr:hypothetical protein Q1695_007545 [Nippostrongylus brasiliensis]
MDRFLSGFADKCLKSLRLDSNVCYLCRGDMSCLLSRLSAYLLKAQQSRHFDNNILHFAPQTWYCDFFDKYEIIKYRKGPEGSVYMADQLDSIFQRVGIPKAIREKIHSEVRVGRDYHSTHDSEERKQAEQTLMSNKTMLLMLTRLYYYDFIVFDFPLPILD